VTLAHVQRLDRHRLPVGEAKAAGDHDGLGRRYVHDPAQPRSRGGDAELEGAARRSHPAPAHVVGERRHRQLLRDLRLADERAGAAAADDVALALEVVERRAHGQSRHAKVRRELALGRDRVAHLELLDEVEDEVAGLALLGHEETNPTSGIGVGSTTS
jgi:hypothetical protein